LGRVTRLRKLRRLEDRTAGVAASVSRLEEVRRERVLEAALGRLSDEDLVVVGVIVDSALEHALASLGEAGTTTNLYEFAETAHERQSLTTFARAVAAVQSEADEKRLRGA
jgi:hypothetical protein